MVVADLEGKVVEGGLRPSSDLDTHLALYRAFPAIGGVVHTQFAARHGVGASPPRGPLPGHTHADYFHGPIPVTAPLTPPNRSGLRSQLTGWRLSGESRGATRWAAPRRWWPATARSVGAPRLRRRRTRRHRRGTGGHGVASPWGLTPPPDHRRCPARQALLPETRRESVLRGNGVRPRRATAARAAIGRRLSEIPPDATMGFTPRCHAEANRHSGRRSGTGFLSSSTTSGGRGYEAQVFPGPRAR